VSDTTASVTSPQPSNRDCDMPLRRLRRKVSIIPLNFSDFNKIFSGIVETFRVFVVSFDYKL
ncbi:MAG: hypothetical protein K2H44_08770, partial [Muribaculaceae bacterium]|nr:hypothetical protein [Muribaculaceae bacterium]